MTEKNRPTSPHLQIYKWNISSLTSIMHRLTGVLLYLSVITICWYIVYYTYQINIVQSSGEVCDCPLQNLFKYAFFVAIIAMTFALYYHFCNGIRHLFWDIGKGFEKETARTNGFLVIALAIIFTAVTVGTAIYLKLF